MFVPVKYAIVKCENQVIFFITLSITLAVIILSTKMRQRTWVAFLHPWIRTSSLWKRYKKDASNDSYKFGDRIRCRVHYPRSWKISRSTCSFEDIWPIDRVADKSYPTSKRLSQSDEIRRNQKLEFLLCYYSKSQFSWSERKFKCYLLHSKQILKSPTRSHSSSVHTDCAIQA